MTNAMMMERSSMMTGMGPMAPGAMGATATMPMPPQWMMVPRCTMTMETCKGGMKITCKCDDTNFVPEFRGLTGRHPRVAKYIRSFPQTQEFINRISELLVYLLPHYIREGKSYLTIGFGCTGGQHRSVMIAEDVRQRLRKAGYKVKVVHRDSPK